MKHHALYLILCAIRDIFEECGAERSKVLDSQIADAATDPSDTGVGFIGEGIPSGPFSRHLVRQRKCLGHPHARPCRAPALIDPSAGAS